MILYPLMSPFFSVFVFLAVMMVRVAMEIVLNRAPVIIVKRKSDRRRNDNHPRLVIFRDVDNIQYDTSPRIHHQHLVVIVNILCAPRCRWQLTG